MAFKSKKELDGAIDPNINARGRGYTENGLSRKGLREKEFMYLLRKIKPHLSESINVAARIMKDDNAAETNQLKACVIILNAYRELVKDVYTDDEAETNVETPTAVPIQDHHNPVFSLTVLK